MSKWILPEPGTPTPFADRFVAMQEALDEVQGTYYKLQVNIARKHMNEGTDLEPLRNAHQAARVAAMSLYNDALTKWQLLEEQSGSTQEKDSASV